MAVGQSKTDHQLVRVLSDHLDCQLCVQKLGDQFNEITADGLHFRLWIYSGEEDLQMVMEGKGLPEMKNLQPRTIVFLKKPRRPWLAMLREKGPWEHRPAYSIGSYGWPVVKLEDLLALTPASFWTQS